MSSCPYRLVDPPADHLDEAASYQAALERAAWPRPETLLELGAAMESLAKGAPLVQRAK